MMPAQHQDEWCHVDVRTGDILEGPMALPRIWGGVNGFNNLKAPELMRRNWFPVRDDSVVPEGAEHTFLFLPERSMVLKVPLGDKVYRGGTQYAILQLYQMFTFFTEYPFYSDVTGEMFLFPNKACEQAQRNNCFNSGRDYTCMAQTLGRKHIRVFVPHCDIHRLMGDAAAHHDTVLEKLFRGLADIQIATDAELVALLDTNLADYYG